MVRALKYEKTQTIIRRSISERQTNKQTDRLICSGTMQTVEHTHLATCSQYGRSYAHDALKHTVGQLVHTYGTQNAKFNRFEPRRQFLPGRRPKGTRPRVDDQRREDIRGRIGDSRQCHGAQIQISRGEDHGKPDKNTTGTVRTDFKRYFFEQMFELLFSLTVTTPLIDFWLNLDLEN